MLVDLMDNVGMKKNTRILLWLPAVIIVLMIAAWFWNYYRIPSLARGLPSNFELGESEFQKRVNNILPVGTENAVVVEYLSNQGFSTRTLDSESERIASFSKLGFPCELVWRIYWTIDEKDKLSTIEARYGGVCL